MVVALALVLSSSNLYGYVRCKMSSKDLKTSLTQFVGKKLFFKVSIRFRSFTTYY